MGAGGFEFIGVTYGSDLALEICMSMHPLPIKRGEWHWKLLTINRMIDQNGAAIDEFDFR